MKESASIQLRMSELREKINSFGVGDDDVEYRQDEADALTAEYRALESRYRVALIKESEEIEQTPTGNLDSEKRESRALELSIETRAYIASLLQDSPLSTKEAEYNASLGIAGGGRRNRQYAVGGVAIP